MALTRNSNGTYTIKNRKQAIKAVKMAQDMAKEINDLRKEHGIEEMEIDSTEMMRAVTRYMTEKKTDEIPLGDGRYVKRIEADLDRKWLLDGTEIPVADMPPDAKTLKQIFRKLFRDTAKRKEILAQVTKRVVDPDALSDLVAQGVLTDEQIAPALVTRKKSPYSRVYGEESS